MTSTVGKKEGRAGRQVVSRDLNRIIRRVVQTLNKGSQEVRGQAIWISDGRPFQKEEKTGSEPRRD